MGSRGRLEEVRGKHGVYTRGQREPGERGLTRGRGQGGAHCWGERHSAAIWTKQPAKYRNYRMLK